MAGNTFGSIFKLTTFGESHGYCVGGVLDGCPAGLKIDTEKIDQHLALRRPGQSDIVSERNEEDKIEILSGIFNGMSTGHPIAFLIKNKDQRSKDYSNLIDVYRPSHADFTYEMKYGIRDHKGGGRSSARETAVRVAAGSIASQFLDEYDIDILAWTHSIGNVTYNTTQPPAERVSVYNSKTRCPDETISNSMESHLSEIRSKGDTVGGIIKCIARNVPVGLGEPIYDKLNAELAKAMFSINAVKGFEIGSGFEASKMMGSAHNDKFISTEQKIRTETNNSGGIQGGISNGEPLLLSVAFKPISTIQKEQQTVNSKGEEIDIKIEGRHDPCVIPRAVVIVESMTALVLADHLLRNRSSKI